MAKIVTAPLIAVSDKDGRHHYLKAGAEVPAFVSADDQKVLAKRGLIGDGSKPEPKVAPKVADAK
ncbi:hypothetical protein [Cumulibacter soli]|uniref:hypothetical protein n=1 Tax=Cumulibacter soli TaxID=2546344 RepID=UPI0010682C35|nr:hypothetical protein [Cumulibacter soli]